MNPKIRVFGASIHYGQELPQDALVNVDEWLKDNFGQPPYDRTKPSDYDFKIRKAWTDHLHTLDDYHEQCFKMNWVGQVAAELGLEVVNYCKPGSANNGIMYNILKHWNDIEENDIIIVATTYPDRITRFKDDGFFDTSNRHIAMNSEHMMYIELDKKYGDDDFSVLLAWYNYTHAIANLLKNHKHILYDPIGIRWFADKTVTGKLKDNKKYHEIKELILNNNPTVNWPALMIYAHEKGERGEDAFCLLGHPDVLCHSWLANNYGLDAIRKLL